MHSVRLSLQDVSCLMLMISLVWNIAAENLILENNMDVALHTADCYALKPVHY